MWWVCLQTTCQCHTMLAGGKSQKRVSYLSEASTKHFSGYDPAFPKCLNTGLPSKFKCWC